MAWTELLWVAAALLAVLYCFLTSDFDYFDEKRVPYKKPLPLLGNMGPLVFKKKPLALLSQDFYHQFKSFGMGGIFEYRKPVIVICEPEVVWQLYMKEYDNVMDRSASTSKEAEGLFQKSILALSGQRWRDMRATLNPVFSPTKLHAMLPLLHQCAQKAADLLSTAARERATAGGSALLEVEMEDLFKRLTANAIAAAGFGIASDSLAEPHNEFLVMGAEAADLDGRRTLVNRAYALLPSLMQTLDVQPLSAQVQSYFRSLVRNALRSPERDTGSATDVLHQLVAARCGGARAVHEDADARLAESPRLPEVLTPQDLSTQLSDEDIAAQVLVFFTKGFETTSALLSFLVYLLALHPDAQARVREEMEELVVGDGKKLTLEALQKMKYLDMVISETLRMYPPAPVSARTCTRTLVVKGTERRSGFVVRPGDVLWLPTYALHHDPHHFPDPDKFDPERFSEENKAFVKPFTYVPFGAGPRSCLGMQFAMMEVKIIMVHLLSRFDIKVIDKTPVPLKLTKKSCRMTVDEGFWVGMEPRQEALSVYI